MRLWVAILALAVLVLPESALAQTRRAFIAAVGDYRSLTDLQKTLGDAQGYAEVFRNNLKFEVTQAPANATRAQFNAAFGQFLASIRPGDEVAFIFSGHGWSDGVENFLALSDAPRDASEYELKTETVALTANILAQINSRSPRLTLAIIDACRDNPFDNGTKAGFEKGLVRTEVAAGTMVVYAAGQRQKALDRLSSSDNAQYSLFTRVLLPKLRDPALPLMTGVDEARDEVARLAGTVNHQQRPAVYSDVSLAFCFSGACRGGAAGDNDTALWVEITSSDATCTDYERYRRQYPDGRYATQAIRILSRPPCAAPPVAATLDAASGPAAAFDAAKSGQDIAQRTFRDLLKDGSKGPELVALPVGSFLMGTPTSVLRGSYDNEPVPREVTIGRQVAIMKFEVTVGDFRRYVERTGRQMDSRMSRFHNPDGEWEARVPRFGCQNYLSIKRESDASWADPKLAQDDRHPVVCVNQEDAIGYAEWLSAETGERYRLPTEAEWEFAARAGSNERYSWGSSSPSCNPTAEAGANYFMCPQRGTLPVGSFRPNGFGVHDMQGNVWEMTEDCFGMNYPKDRPVDGSAYRPTNPQHCLTHSSRGGSWYDDPKYLYVSSRHGLPHETNTVGFRLVREE